MIKNFIKNMLSAVGDISSKRVSGMCTLALSMGCIIYLTISEGGTSAVENLLQTAMFVAAGLLGVSSITNIWKNRNNNNKKGSE